MPIGKKIRIYDLARDLKQDAKRVMEDLRREGADVSVPSNSVSVELAEKVRLRYFPKADVAPKRGIKIIKASKKEESPDELETPAVESEAAAEPAPEPTPTPAPEEVPEAAEPEAAKPAAATRKKLTKKAVVPDVLEPVAAAPEADAAPEIESPEAGEQPAESTLEGTERAAGSRVLRPTGTQIKQLTLTRDALDKGVKPGERVVSEAPTKTGRLGGEAPVVIGRDGKPRRAEFRGTPGETATPQITYTPPADNRRRPGRSGGRKGKGFEKGGRFAERDV
ncbi:MAG TPA: hypothetical protein VK468_03585, partial [Pyrinomonadaceae bacterium]|nr:hypothetical protein [Pyrinomonadaceae bacterium]